MIGIDSILLDAAGVTIDGDYDGVRCWHVDSIDRLNCIYLDGAPDLTAPLCEIDTLRSFYRRTLKDNVTAFISVDATKIDGCEAIRTIVKGRIPNQPHGMLYIAAITVPFRDFCFIFKTICEEQGTTGLREAVVLNELLGEGQIKSAPSGELIGWSADPYDTALTGGILRNLSEDEKYDAKFAFHPLTRARRIMKMLEDHILISDEVRSAPHFDGPKKIKKKWLW